MFTFLKFHKHYFGALEVKSQEMRMGQRRGSRPALQNQKTCLEKDKSNHGLAKEEDGNLTLPAADLELQGGDEGRETPKHPYLEANSSNPLKGEPIPLITVFPKVPF